MLMRRVSTTDKIPNGLLRSAVASGIVVASGVTAATMGGVGTANATCLSVSGINIFGSECTSSPLSFAFALGPNLEASANGLFTSAIAIGTRNVADAEGFLTAALAIGFGDAPNPGPPQAEAHSAGALSLAYAGGNNALAEAFGNLAIAAAQGDENVALAGETPTDIGNVALSLGNNNAVTAGVTPGPSSGTPSYFNLALNLGEGNALLGQDGTGNSLLNFFGNGNTPLGAGGVFNNVTNFFGDGNLFVAGNEPDPDAGILQQIGGNVVGGFFVDNLAVSSGPGPFEINIRTPFNTASSLALNNLSVSGGEEQSGTQGGVVKQLLSFRPGNKAGSNAASLGGSTGGPALKSVGDRITTSVKKLSDTVNNVTRRLAERAKTGPANTSSEG